MSRFIQFSSGAFIERVPDSGYDEIWRINNKAMAVTKIILDLRASYNCYVEGHEYEQIVEASAGPYEEKVLFVIRRNPPFKFSPRITAEEEPISFKKQDKFIHDSKESLNKLIDEMQDFIQGIPFEVMDTDEIIAKIREEGFDHFIDPSFPPNDKSIYSAELDGKFPLKEKPVWKRPTEFMKSTPQVFESGIDPNDINQGSLGDCWFLAAVASIAENPALVKRLFLTQEFNKEGVYRLKICKNGEWVEVIVDDYFPCHLNGGPMFKRSKGDELWVLLLEKAYAKLHGGYWQLRSGFVYHAMGDLTGCPSLHNTFPKNRHDYNAIEDYADELWHNLTKADVKGFIMCASTPGVDRFTEFGGPTDKSGIVPGHAYSVISCKTYKGIRLLQIRNPWGEFEWGGAWSDNSSEWTQEYIEAFKPSFDDKDGTFWMAYEDFFKYFTSITVCKIANFNEVRLKGKFFRVWEEEDPDEDWVLSKFYYSFRLEEKAKIDIGLHQEDERILGANKRRYVDLQVLILRRHINGSLTLVHDSDSKVDRDNDTCVDLEPGHYIVIPRTCGATLSAPKTKEPPCDPRVEYDGREYLHCNYASTFNDVFRRIDIQLNGKLSVGEINQFGELIDNDTMRYLDEDALTSSKFSRISCDEEGVTQYGMTQVMSQFGLDSLHYNLSKLGYDESLYSTKAKVFTISFHTNAKLRVRIGDAMKTDLNERAWDLMMEKYHQDNGATGAIQNNQCVLFRRMHKRSYSVSYAAINKTEHEIEVILKQQRSTNMLFTPSKGSTRTTVPPRALVFMGSSILEPGKDRFAYNYSFSSRIL